MSLCRVPYLPSLPASVQGAKYKEVRGGDDPKLDDLLRLSRKSGPVQLPAMKEASDVLRFEEMSPNWI